MFKFALKYIHHSRIPNLFASLPLKPFFQFWMTAIAITLPVPAGVFMPVFTIGELRLRFPSYISQIMFCNTIRSFVIQWCVFRSSFWKITWRSYGSMVSKWYWWRQNSPRWLRNCWWETEKPFFSKSLPASIVLTNILFM